MKKALFIVNSIRKGGAERVCINLAEGLIEKGYAVDIISLSKIENEAIKNSEINFYSLGYDLDKKHSKLKCLLFGHQKINKLVNNKKYNLITSHLPLANIITRMSVIRKKSIYVMHSALDLFKGCNRLLFKAIYKRNKIVCVSKGIEKQIINDYHIKKTHLRTIYNPIDIVKIRSGAKEKITGINNPYLLLVGRFEQQKRHDRMIEIYEKGNFSKKFDLVFCGAGSLENKIKQCVQEKGLGKNVHFLGWQDNVYKWISHAEMLLCTSDLEGFPMNLIEAFACGTKVVSANCDYGPNEILKNEFSEYLVEKDDIRGYIDAIWRASNNYPKKENPIIQQCSIKTVISQYEEFYEE